MNTDDWTTAALTDVALVADILLRLKSSNRQTPIGIQSMRTETETKMDDLISFRWGRKKARSRPDVMRFAICKEFKERDGCSPTTPLSWSGGCGTSGNVDGFEASSMMSGRSTGFRSKITAAYESINGKMGKRNKTYGELKKEECSLLDESLNLKRDLANMHTSLNHHIVTNQNLNRIKNMNVHSRRVTSCSVTHHQVVSVPIQKFTSTTQRSISKARDSNNEIPQPIVSSNNFPAAKNEKCFTLLPDLNMLPSLE